MRSSIAGLLLLCLLWPASAGGQEPDDETDPPAVPDWNVLSLNVPGRTLGGKQFWSDELVHGQWRIQRNVMSGHYRLLDPQNVRQAWGAWDDCHARWEELRRTAQVPALRPRVVLVLHGLGRTRASMAGIAQYLAERSDYEVLSISYASTRASLADHAASLARVIRRLERVEEINFVAHSMGNLVVRHLLHDQLVAARGLGQDPRIRRIVMLAPPNNGAALAERFEHDPTFRLLFGQGGQQFTEDWDRVQAQLAVPACPFGIIAGSAGSQQGGNPWLEGDDDLIVSVDETRLAGAADFVIVPELHTFIMDHPRVREYTLRFLQRGYFISEEARQPLAAQPEAEGPRR